MARRQALSPPVADPPRPLEGARIGRLATTAAHGALAVAKLIHTEPYGGVELPPVQSCSSRPERMPAMHKFRYRQKPLSIRAGHGIPDVRRSSPRHHESDRPTGPPTRRSHLQRACHTRRRAFQSARLPRHIREVLSGWITASTGQAPPSSSTGGSTKSSTLALSSQIPHAHSPMMSVQGLYGGNPLESSLEECFKAKREEWLTMTREKELKELSEHMTFWVEKFESECKKKPEFSSIITGNFEDDSLWNFKLETDELEPGTFKCSSITVKQFFECYGRYLGGDLVDYPYLALIGFFVLKDLFFRKREQLNELLADILPDESFDAKKKIEIALEYWSLTHFDDTNLDKKIYRGALNGYLAARYGAAYATKPFQRHLLRAVKLLCDHNAETFRELVAENLKRIEGGAEEFGSFIDSVENQDAFLNACFEAEAREWLDGHDQKCPFQPTDGRSAISETVKFTIANWKALATTPEQTDKFREDINKFLRVVEQAIATAKSCTCSNQREMQTYIDKLKGWRSEMQNAGGIVWSAGRDFRKVVNRLRGHVQPASNWLRGHFQPASNWLRGHFQPATNWLRGHVQPASDRLRGHIEPAS